MEVGGMGQRRRRWALFECFPFQMRKGLASWCQSNHFLIYGSNLSSIKYHQLQDSKSQVAELAIEDSIKQKTSNSKPHNAKTNLKSKTPIKQKPHPSNYHSHYLLPPPPVSSSSSPPPSLLPSSSLSPHTLPFPSPNPPSPTHKTLNNALKRLLLLPLLDHLTFPIPLDLIPSLPCLP